MSEDYAYGREEIAFVTEESSYGTLVQPTATDAMKILSTDMNFKQERKDRPEKGSTRSITSRITGRKTADWSLEKFLLPSGAAGTKPDDALLWEALFGTETVNASTNVIYSLAAEPAKSLDIFREDGHFREAVCGAVPSKWSLKWGGGDEPKVTFSGEAKDHYMVGSDTLAEDASATTTIVVNNALQFCIGMLIKVGTENNTGAGYNITAINYTTDTLTLSASVTSQTTGAAVIPLPITPTTAGDVIPVTVGHVKIGSDMIYVTAAGFDIDQKVKLRNDEFATDSASGHRHPEFREVTLSLTLYFEKAAVKRYNDIKRFTSQDIETLLGDTAGKKVQVDANQVEFDFTKVDIPDSDEATITLPGKCLGSSGEDEISVTFL